MKIPITLTPLCENYAADTSGHICRDRWKGISGRQPFLRGVILTNKLFSADNPHHWRKVSRAIRVLKRAKQFLPQNILKNLYVSIVEPHFRYCSSVWGCCSTTVMGRLRQLHNRAVRIISNSALDAPAKLLNFSCHLAIRGNST